MFWTNVAELYAKQPEAGDSINSADSLNSRFQTVQSQVQKSLSAEGPYYSNQQPSGTSVSDERVHIMNLYYHKARKVGKTGGEKDAPALKSLGAVQVLRNFPKFGSSGNHLKIT